MHPPRTTDVVVVGSGIVGAATAAAAACRGVRVVLLDKEDGPAREGSGRAQGSLRVQGRHGAEFPLARESLELWTAAASEGDFELVVGGNLYLRTTDDELPVLQALVDEAQQVGLSQVQLLDANQTRGIVPCATGEFLGAMPRGRPLPTGERHRARHPPRPTRRRRGCLPRQGHPAL